MRQPVVLTSVAMTLAAAIASISLDGQGPAARIGTGVITGVVTSPSGAEAGVWVIAGDRRPADEVPQDRRHRR